MQRFPREFADLLNHRGRRMLEGRVPAAAGALARSYFTALTGAFPDSCVAVVTHLGVIRAVLGAPLDHAAWRWL